jgi:serine/threonine protein phosphatase PrpC
MVVHHGDARVPLKTRGQGSKRTERHTMSDNSEGEGRQGAEQGEVRPNGAATGAAQGPEGAGSGGQGHGEC